MAEYAIVKDGLSRYTVLTRFVPKDVQSLTEAEQYPWVPLAYCDTNEAAITVFNALRFQRDRAAENVKQP